MGSVDRFLFLIENNGPLWRKQTAAKIILSRMILSLPVGPLTQQLNDLRDSIGETT